MCPGTFRQIRGRLAASGGTHQVVILATTSAHAPPSACIARIPTQNTIVYPSRERDLAMPSRARESEPIYTFATGLAARIRYDAHAPALERMTTHGFT